MRMADEPSTALTLPDLRTDDVLTWDKLGYPKPARGPLSKAVIRQAYVELVVPEIQEIVASQIARARGIKHLVARLPDGKFKKISAEQLNDFEHVEVWERDPDMNAITDLLNRVMDKPKEQAQEVEVAAKVEFSWKTEE